jgi:hypothetical protein
VEFEQNDINMSNYYPELDVTAGKRKASPPKSEVPSAKPSKKRAVQLQLSASTAFLPCEDVEMPNVSCQSKGSHKMAQRMHILLGQQYAESRNQVQTRSMNVSSRNFSPSRKQLVLEKEAHRFDSSPNISSPPHVTWRDENFSPDDNFSPNQNTMRSPLSSISNMQSRNSGVKPKPGAGNKRGNLNSKATPHKCRKTTKTTSLKEMFANSKKVTQNTWIVLFVCPASSKSNMINMIDLLVFCSMNTFSALQCPEKKH